jgi:hypothetical protein
MRLLVEFLVRFGFGIAMGLVLTPAALVPGGFFRVNLLVVMGLSTFAALLGHSAGAAGWQLAAAAAVGAWVGSVAWLGEHRRTGLLACAACATLLAGAAAALRGLPAATVPLLSGLVTGLTVHAMLLGHWYLNAPGMRVDVLRRAIDMALAVWGVRLVIAGVEAGAAVRGSSGLAVGADSTTVALVALRWLAGLVGLPVLLVMARKTLDIPNTQSATGILYVACLAAILGELTAQLLAAAG